MSLWRDLLASIHVQSFPLIVRVMPPAAAGIGDRILASRSKWSTRLIIKVHRTLIISSQCHGVNTRNVNYQWQLVLLPAYAETITDSCSGFGSRSYRSYSVSNTVLFKPSDGLPVQVDVRLT